MLVSLIQLLEIAFFGYLAHGTKSVNVVRLAAMGLRCIQEIAKN